MVRWTRPEIRPSKLGEVHVGCEYRGFIWGVFRRIEEKR